MPESYEIKITLTPDPEHPNETLTNVSLPAGIPGQTLAIGIQQLSAALLAQAPNDQALHSAKLGLYQDLGRLPSFKQEFEGYFKPA